MPYADPEMRKQYHRDYQRAYYHRHRSTMLDYTQRPEVKERARKRAAKYAAMFPGKRRARNAVNNAIRDGRLKREPCEVCGEFAEAHHLDYRKPLDVKWLCREHHNVAHGKVVDLKVNGESLED